MSNKCFDCHDKKTKTPVYHHQQDGIKALDFSQKIPLLAQGRPYKISLLKAIKNEVLDRSMALKAYTIVYRARKVNANGINRGKFSDMQDTPTLMRSKFFDLKNSSQSLIYKLSFEKKMPHNKRDALSDEELLLFNDWPDAQAREIP